MSNYLLKEINKENMEEFFAREGCGLENISSWFNKELFADLGLKSAIIYCYDKILTENAEDLDFDLDNVIEARVFNENEELRIWREDNKFKGAIFKETEGGDQPIETTFLLYPREKTGYNPGKFIVKKYLNYDNDGQAYISYTKPAQLI